MTFKDKLYWKKLFHLPIYRVDILKYALKHKEYHKFGICNAIQRTLCDVGIFPEFFYCEKTKFFPELVYDKAVRFGASGIMYWWPEGDWDSGRADFLKWLIEYYKYDKKDLRTINQQQIT